MNKLENKEILPENIYKQLKIDNCDIEITCEDCGNIFEIKKCNFLKLI